jgi:4-hydroxybenzoate polyprenyltransferase
VALALAMTGFQASIGALNDIHDRSDDEVAKPWKPLPAGRVTSGAARATALGGGLLGTLLSAAVGPAALAIGLIGYGLGVAYDLRLKRTGWGWLALALALPLVPVYAWLGAAAVLPPNALVLAVMGPLAGLALACANGLVDLESDAAAGGRGVAVRLGRGRATAAIVAADSALVAVAWTTSTGARGLTPVLVAATVTLVLGAAWSARMAVRWRWLGWQTQAAGVAILAVGWLAGAARAGG